ncbi:methylmalonyl-CoA epimerase [Salana multivorans]|uniref:Methylmalonyl-CoA epimerase n=1 Tax=Salana multivorans TaxID=120377 RepID=A0A3N2D9L2_9MICO|nr:VOC family protein [Salana multivorans]MBN8881775.1 VOC family protein [Salana multivorans]OJX97330.1 MAG: hypothetical protein BGO96_05170 [Micrococcales bacterium 73-15]ROR96328.1 methylmalonyl-CoA epimerase [Salana multivorans]
MSARLIHHIGILVPDLEGAIELWSAITGYTFGPIHRYRSTHYVDDSDPTPHFHDARLSFSVEGAPHIELLEATGEGTHSLAQAGVHHLAFTEILELDDEIERLAQLGVTVNGVDRNPQGEPLLFFTEPRTTSRVRVEFVAPLDHPNVMDDGSPLWRDPATGRLDPWGPRDS